MPRTIDASSWEIAALFFGNSSIDWTVKTSEEATWRSRRRFEAIEDRRVGSKRGRLRDEDGRSRHGELKSKDSILPLA